MKLWYARGTRAVRPRWMLEELGLPYELVRVDLKAGEQRSPAYLAIHPHGAVPAFEADDGTRMFESVAIVRWLADAFPDRGLAPPLGTPARAAYEQWTTYAVATAEPPIVQFASHTRWLPEERRVPALAEDGQGKTRQVAAVVQAALRDRPYLLGDAFTAADLVLASVVMWARPLGLLADFPALLAWSDRCTARPAFQRARAD